jgi:hypothetical protein
VLSGVDDVETGVGEEAADPRDQPRLVGAGEQQPGGRVRGDARIMTARPAAWGMSAAPSSCLSKCELTLERIVV